MEIQEEGLKVLKLICNLKEDWVGGHVHEIPKFFIYKCGDDDFRRFFKNCSEADVQTSLTEKELLKELARIHLQHEDLSKHLSEIKVAEHGLRVAQSFFGENE